MSFHTVLFSLAIWTDYNVIFKGLMIQWKDINSFHHFNSQPAKTSNKHVSIEAREAFAKNIYLELLMLLYISVKTGHFVKKPKKTKQKKTEIILKLSKYGFGRG